MCIYIYTHTHTFIYIRIYLHLVKTLFYSTDWRDAELMRDIEAATGENLGSDRVSKKGKGKKKKYPNLSDLKQSSSTSRSRLEKKIFNKYIPYFNV